MQIDAVKTVQVEAKTLAIHLKVRDEFCAEVLDQDGARLGGQDDGYVPGFMPGDHYGDYVILNIDIDTGQITNWKTPTAEQIQKFINPSDDD